MTIRRQVADAYFDGFRANDHAMILACLADDVVWDIHGHRHLEGKAAFAGEIDGGGEGARVDLATNRVIEDGDTIAVLGIGTAPLPDGGKHRFAYATVLTFRDQLVSHVESFIVPLAD